ncbi:MAG: hypothetical protein KKD38_00055, partial [Candidatus Delongbacteria bacterium]|nr:hypothetical protein [Candidatus Delongbacteria bacterium]
MYHGLWKGNFDAIAGTNIIGGLWLLIPGKPLLIWSRLGYIIIQILTAYFSFKILLLYFKPFRVFAVCLVVSISLSFWQYYFTINYDNLPLIFLLLSIYLILKENKTPSKHNRAVLITAGVLIIISIFCKITYLPAVL